MSSNQILLSPTASAFFKVVSAQSC